MVSKTTEFELNKWELNCEICSYEVVSNMSDPVHLAISRIKLEGCDIVQVLAETEYQDLYRITDGVLLVINKFEYIDYDGWMSLYNPKAKKYHEGCQTQLKELKKDYYHSYTGMTIPKGTILYYGVPVRTVEKDKWKYEIKTTGNSFSGDIDRMTELINEILKKINSNRE